MSSFAFVRVVPIRIYLASSSRMEYAWRLPILSNTSVATPLFSSSSSYNSAIWSCGCSPSVLFMLSITWAVSFSRRSRVVLSSRSTVFLYTAVRQQQLQRQGRMHARPVSKMYVRCADHCGRQPANSQLASALTQSQASWGKGPAGNDVALPAWVTALDAASTLHVVNDSSLALDRFVGGNPSDCRRRGFVGLEPSFVMESHFKRVPFAVVPYVLRFTPTWVLRMRCTAVARELGATYSVS